MRINENKTSAKNCNSEKNETAKYRQKEVYHNLNYDENNASDRESRLIPRKIKDIPQENQSTYSLKNPNHITTIFYMLPEVWFPSVQQFLVTYLLYTHSFGLIKLIQISHFSIHKTLQSNFKSNCIMQLLLTQIHKLCHIVSIQVCMFSINKPNIIILCIPSDNATSISQNVATLNIFIENLINSLTITPYSTKS